MADDNNLTVNNCYRNSAFSSSVETGDEIALDQMKTVAFVYETLGWDDSIWKVTDGEFPTL